MGIPAYPSMTKKELTNSEEGHIGIWRRDNKIIIDLWFNAMGAVNKFVNILHPYQKKERDLFIKLVGSLDNRYKIIVHHDEKFWAGSANWKPVIELKCNELNDEKIIDLLETIKLAKEKRDERQKKLPKSQKATMAISLMEIDITEVNDEELKEILQKIIEMTRLTRRLKKSKILERTKKEQEENLKFLKARAKRIEEGLEEDPWGEYSQVLEEIKKIEEST